MKHFKGGAQAIKVRETLTDLSPVVEGTVKN
jgi:hypothetical protein